MSVALHGEEHGLGAEFEGLDGDAFAGGVDGGETFDPGNKEKPQRNLVRRLEGLGLKVMLEQAAVAT